MRRARWKRRLYWTALIVALLLIWLIAQVLRAAEAIAEAARRRRAAAGPFPTH